jgi:hypothetical protein
VKRDIFLLLTISCIITVLFGGLFVRGIKDVSLIENRTLTNFPKVSMLELFETNYQDQFEKALSDQLLFGGTIKAAYITMKNNNVQFMVSLLKKVEEFSHILDQKEEQPETTKVASQSLEKAQSQTTSESVNPLEKQEEDRLNQDVLSTQEQRVSLIREPAYTSFEIALTPRGNGLIEIDDTRHLIYPNNNVKQPHDLIISKIDNINTLVKNYPTLNYFCYYIETDMDVEFVDGKISHFIVNPFFSRLDHKIEKAALYINEPKEYQTFFYKTDHHWDVKGQLQGYQDIIRLTKGLQEPLRTTEEVYIEGLKYYGSKSRISNDYEIYDDFKVLIADLSEHKEYVNDVEQLYDRKEAYVSGTYTKTEGVSYYGNCNGGDYGLVTYDYNQPDKSNILIFVDSFSNPINSFIASHFNKTYIVDLRYYKDTYGVDFDFGDFTKEHEIRDVLFMGYYLFYANDIFLVTD